MGTRKTAITMTASVISSSPEHTHYSILHETAMSHVGFGLAADQAVGGVCVLGDDGEYCSHKT